ncbi:b980d20b-e1cf-4b1d-a4b9-3b114e56faea [Thermothielavioides terrestris]|nr:b980d20b-e1cf-4b1d-a4b9-3b114e56faea [Thermothielavioides terrestris]
MKLADTLPQSAKTTVLQNIVLEWCDLYPGDKIIVFTEFVLLGRLVGRMLQDHDIDFLYYFGSMSHSEKNKAVNDFANNENIRVLIASIKCGGQALNLTCANRVIILDHWWNSAVEQQAFGRVYRMGQTKETYFARIMAKNTIDERLVQIQKDKLKMISQTIEDHDSSKNAISFEELVSLFGRPVRDKSGRIIGIEPDYDDEVDEDEDGDLEKDVDVDDSGDESSGWDSSRE